MTASDLEVSKRLLEIARIFAPLMARVAPVPRLSLRVSEAAEALGVSEDFYTANIAPELQIVRRGKLKLVAVSELQRWLNENGERVLDAEHMMNR